MLVNFTRSVLINFAKNMLEMLFNFCSKMLEMLGDFARNLNEFLILLVNIDGNVDNIW